MTQIENGGRGLTRMNADTTKGRGLALKHRQITELIIGVFFDVYNDLGFGYLESVYRHAMAIALRDAGLSARHEVPLNVYFRGQVVGCFRADFLVESVVVVELKAAAAISGAHEAQLLNYLRGTRLEVGVLFNFGPKPRFRRLVFDPSRIGTIRVHPR